MGQGDRSERGWPGPERWNAAWTKLGESRNGCEVTNPGPQRHTQGHALSTYFYLEESRSAVRTLTRSDLGRRLCCFAAVGALVPMALKATRKGGRVVCAGIHMSDIPSFPYELLWGERTITSVANLTRADGADFMEVAARAPLRPKVELFALSQANEALESLRRGALNGAAVLTAEARD